MRSREALEVRSPEFCGTPGFCAWGDMELKRIVLSVSTAGNGVLLHVVNEL